MAGVWVATLERFGYTLIVAEKSRDKALAAMSEEYKRTYCKWNELPSMEEMEQDEEFKEYYACAMEEVYCRRLEYGKVEWC